ncbi:MAG TPA: hypothetical protein PLX89_22295 [Verrucomicrobiota bacterium]|nr:hypothetical protein [Verrucomicrobiales bacterium]HRI15737.1 hypothetical protein [Verrucomicrobiota bacterium]
MNRSFGTLSRIAVGLLLATTLQASPSVGRVSVDDSKVVEHAAWAQSAECLANEWYPRIGSLLLSSTEVSLPDVQIEISPDDDGVAAAAGWQFASRKNGFGSPANDHRNITLSPSPTP